MVVRGPNSTQNPIVVARVFAILALAFLCASGVLWFLHDLARQRRRALLANGRRVPGQVEQRYAIRARGSHYFVIYKFTDGGVTRSAEEQVTKELFLRAEKGASVFVRIDGQDPARFSLEEGSIDSAATWIFVPAIVFTALSAAFGLTSLVLRLVASR